MFTIIFFLALLVMFAMTLFWIYFVDVPYYVAALVPNWFGGVRVIGPGKKFVFRPFESVGESGSLKELAIDDKMDCETSGEEVITLDYSVQYWSLVHQMVTRLRFPKEQIESAIKQRVKSILSVEVRARVKRDDVYKDLAPIAQSIEQKFNASFAAQYGVQIRFVIDDPELPPKLVEAEVEREIMEKTREKKKIEIKMINENRGKEMTKLKSMANAWVKQAEKNGQKLDFQTALKIIQTQLGIIKESTETKGLNRDTLNTLQEILPVIAKEIFNRDVPMEKLEQVLSKVVKEALDGRK